MTLFDSITNAFNEIFAAIGEDVFVLGVFVLIASLVKFAQRGKLHKAHRLPTAKSYTPKCKPGKTAPPRHHDKDCAGHRQPCKKGLSDGASDHQRESHILQLLEDHEFTRALNLFRSCECQWPNQSFSEALFFAITESAIRVGKLDVVQYLLLSLKRQSVQLSVQYWQAILKMLCGRKYFDTCLSVYTILGPMLPADKVVFSCLINAALDKEAPEQATSLLPRYCECDLEPQDYILLFRTYAATNDIQAAETTFRLLGEKSSPLMLNLALLACTRSQQPERAMHLLQEAHGLEDARGTAVREHIVDVVSYNTVIKGFAAVGTVARCFECLDKMAQHGVQPDDVTYCTLMDMCITSGDMNAGSESVQHFLNAERPLDTVTCTLFMKAFVRAQQLPKAMELYKDMKLRSFNGTRPDVITYSILIKANVDQHDLQRALLLLEDMLEAKLFPDDIILTHLLEGCRYAGKLALAKKLFQDIVAAGVKPSAFTLMAMIKVHGRCGTHCEARQLIKNSAEHLGLKPTVMHYTCLMSGCLRSKCYDQAWEAYELMIEHGITPDKTTVDTLLPALVAAKQWERVLTLAKRALLPTSGSGITAQTFKPALFQMERANGQEFHTRQLQSLMQGVGAPHPWRASKEEVGAPPPWRASKAKIPKKAFVSHPSA